MGKIDNDIKIINETLSSRFNIEVKTSNFFTKLFLKCYNIKDVMTIIKKFLEELNSLKEDIKKDKDIIKSNYNMIQDQIEMVKEKNNIIKELELSLQKEKDKYKKDIDKLSKTLQTESYNNGRLKEEVVGLRKDLCECRDKIKDENKHSTNETAKFIDSLVKKNEKLTNQLNKLKEEKKNKKV